MKVLGIISSQNDPASRFRIMQYKNYLHDLDTNMLCSIPWPPKESSPHFIALKNRKIWSLLQIAGRGSLLLKQYFYDLIWQNRLLLDDYYCIEKHFKKPVVFDFDDAIWLTEGKKQVDKAIAGSTLIFAGNEYLAEYAKKINKNIKIIPSTIDTGVFKPILSNQLFFVAGWIGTHSNFAYLEQIKGPLLDFLQQTKDTKLTIISSEPPSFLPFDNERIFFKKWKAEKENEWINEFSVGLMPLPDNEWTRGKCAYKMLQYLACGKPVIASPVGVNKNILSASGGGIAATTESDWLKSMHELKNDTALFKNYSQRGVPYIAKNYSCKQWATNINEYFKELC